MEDYMSDFDSMIDYERLVLLIVIAITSIRLLPMIDYMGLYNNWL